MQSHVECLDPLQYPSDKYTAPEQLRAEVIDAPVISSSPRMAIRVLGIPHPV